MTARVMYDVRQHYCLAQLLLLGSRSSVDDEKLFAPVR